MRWTRRSVLREIASILIAAFGVRARFIFVVIKFLVVVAKLILHKTE